MIDKKGYNRGRAIVTATSENNTIEIKFDRVKEVLNKTETDILNMLIGKLQSYDHEEFMCNECGGYHPRTNLIERKDGTYKVCIDCHNAKPSETCAKLS